MKKVYIKEVMVTNLITAHLDDRLSKLEEKFRLNRIRHLPVVDENRKLVGIFTHRDLSRCVTPKKTENGFVFDPEQEDRFILKYVMTQDPITLGPDDTLFHAVEIMVRDKFGCIPIVNEDKTLVGIVTQIDALKFLYNSFK